MQCISVFLDIENLLIFGKKMLMSAELKGYVTWFIYILIFFRLGITAPRFIIVGYVWQTWGRGNFLLPPIRQQSLKSPSWIGLSHGFISNFLFFLFPWIICGMADRRKAFSLISSRDHCQRSSPSRISDTPRAGFERAQSLSSALVEWSCAVVITTTPQRRFVILRNECNNYYCCSLFLINLRKLLKAEYSLRTTFMNSVWITCIRV